ncbi:hypothetical protein KP509_35G034900 [Ceratopteris richardii]|uniref:Uncharacterized protein n=1 Tax=Ceratopteris richardii TaxID=49495 RepID=A0A8T2QFW7_CERRI|nr:hypothetical protein KP509_35G034900 [Ceratopteris richardii]KAH7282534.1 hypothetical protein KP509_35G034900 [Ceratopteris richardii]
MVSLRRTISLDSIQTVTSAPPHTHVVNIVRHRSLPRHCFLGQPELTMRALRRHSRLSTEGTSRLFRGSHSLLSSKIMARRPLHIERDCERLSGVEDAAGPHRIHELFGRSDVTRSSDFTDKESTVYLEMKESLYRLKAPSKYFSAHCIEKISPRTPTFTNAQQKNLTSDGNLRQNTSEICAGKDAREGPLSLRLLSRKRKRRAGLTSSQRSDRDSSIARSSCLQYSCAITHPNLESFSDSMSTALGSLIYILKTLHQHALSPNKRGHTQIVACDGVFHHPSIRPGRASAEMIESFVWLFEGVFSSTPKLMTLIMLLLAEFTFHSMSKHVAFKVAPATEPPTAATLSTLEMDSKVDSMAEHLRVAGLEAPARTKLGSASCMESFVRLSASGGDEETADTKTDAEHERKVSSSWIEKFRYVFPMSNSHGSHSSEARESSAYQWRASSKSAKNHRRLQHLRLSDSCTDVHERMCNNPLDMPDHEADSYPCFDRTDLTYQEEIRMDPGNPLLLANYAQFLHLVRHHNARAESFFRRALAAAPDGADADVMAKFANFLWIAKGDLAEAERTFQAAAEAEPTNAYHAGSYANFLWSSEACRAEETSTCLIDDNFSINRRHISII